MVTKDHIQTRGGVSLDNAEFEGAKATYLEGKTKNGVQADDLRVLEDSGASVVKKGRALLERVRSVKPNSQ